MHPNNIRNTMINSGVNCFRPCVTAADEAPYATAQKMKDAAIGTEHRISQMEEKPSLIFPLKLQSGIYKNLIEEGKKND